MALTQLGHLPGTPVLYQASIVAHSASSAPWHHNQLIVSPSPSLATGLGLRLTAEIQ